MSRTPLLQAGPRLAARAEAERSTSRRRRWRRVGLALALALPLALMGWLVLVSPVLGVSTVTVTGQARLSAPEVVTAAALADGTPLARVDTLAVARRLERLSPVASATVTRSWPHTVRIHVVERVPVVAVSRAGGVALLDPAGVQVAVARVAPRGVLPLQSATDASTSAALRVLSGLPRPLRNRVAALRASSPEQVTLVLRDGRTVLWGGPVDGQTKASAVLALLRLPGSVYDVSAPGVASRR